MIILLKRIISLRPFFCNCYAGGLDLVPWIYIYVYMYNTCVGYEQARPYTLCVLEHTRLLQCSYISNARQHKYKLSPTLTLFFLKSRDDWSLPCSFNSIQFTRNLTFIALTGFSDLTNLISPFKIKFIIILVNKKIYQ